MPSVNHSSKSILDVINDIYSGRIRVPKFQRDYVWSEGQIKALLDSLISKIPLGAITLWSTNDNDELFENYYESAPFGGLYETEIDSAHGLWKLKKTQGYEAGITSKADNFSGILDGRQRSQTLLLTLGGMITAFKSVHTSRIWFLDLNMELHGEEFPFKSIPGHEAIERSVGDWVSKGQFPLFLVRSNVFSKALLKAANYPNAELPDQDLGIWSERLTDFERIIASTTLATITIENADLNEVCQIFETLNQSGTKVSSIDILHTQLIRQDKENIFEFRNNLEKLSKGSLPNPYPLLRSYISDPGKYKMWANLVTLHYILSDDARKLRPLDSDRSFDSLKGKELIHTPLAQHRFFIHEDQLFTIDKSLGRFQKLNGGAHGSGKYMPYPFFALIFVVTDLLRSSGELGISEEEADTYYSRLFWRTAWSGRYDQGVMTGLPRDAKLSVKFLRENHDLFIKDKTGWTRKFEKHVSNDWRIEMPTPKSVSEDLQRIQYGARKKLYNVLLVSGDPVDLKTGEPLFGLGEPFKAKFDFHHLVPRAWLKDNIGNNDEVKSLKESAAMLAPMGKSSNEEWSSAKPSNVLENWFNDDLSFSTNEKLRERLNSIHLDQPSFEALLRVNDLESWKEFLNSRSKFLAEELIYRKMGYDGKAK